MAAETAVTAAACACCELLPIAFGAGLGVGVLVGIALADRYYREKLIRIARDLGLTIAEFIRQIYCVFNTTNRYIILG